MIASCIQGVPSGLRQGLRVDFGLDVSPSCPTAQPPLPNFHLPWETGQTVKRKISQSTQPRSNTRWDTLYFGHFKTFLQLNFKFATESAPSLSAGDEGASERGRAGPPVQPPDALPRVDVPEAARQVTLLLDGLGGLARLQPHLEHVERRRDGRRDSARYHAAAHVVEQRLAPLLLGKPQILHDVGEPGGTCSGFVNRIPPLFATFLCFAIKVPTNDKRV